MCSRDAQLETIKRKTMATCTQSTRKPTSPQFIMNFMAFTLRGMTVGYSFKMAGHMTPKSEGNESKEERQRVFEQVTDKELKARHPAFVAMLEAWVEDGLFEVFEEVAPVKESDAPKAAEVAEVAEVVELKRTRDEGAEPKESEAKRRWEDKPPEDDQEGPSSEEESD